MSEYLRKRDGFWHYVRRVPAEYLPLVKKEKVRISTKIRVVDDRRGARAAIVADELNKATEQHWANLVNGLAEEATTRYAAARRRARTMGFEYVEAADMGGRTPLEIMERVERLDQAGVIEDYGARAAVMGLEPKPVILLSHVFPEFEKLTREEQRQKSPDQLRIWRNGKKLAIDNFITKVGDKPAHEISNEDVLDFREWWQDRLDDEGLSHQTANKEFGHLSRMFNEINTKHRLGMTNLFAGKRFSGAQQEPRPPFDPVFVQDVLLGHRTLIDLNPEARRILYVMADTGMRPSEICNLNASRIFLDVEIPYVEVRPDDREIKTRQSSRDVPLVGAALAAMKAQPDGFPRYRDKGGSLSATVNAFLRSHNLLPTARHTAYSLRHTFKDKLVAAEAPDSIVDQLMGHREDKPVYGKGASLKIKLKWLHAIAFRPPSRV